MKKQLIENFIVLWTLVLLASGLTACSRHNVKQDPVDLSSVEREISLKKDRSEFDEMRKDVPPELREKNDEWALILKDMDGKRHPSDVRSRFYELVRKKREKFSNELQRKRQEYNKSEEKVRKEFLANLQEERDDFDSKKASSEKRSDFYEDQSDKRRDFFEDQRDKRKDFEEEVSTKHKDFDSYIRDRQKEFDDAAREYQKDWDEQERDKRKLEQAKWEVKQHSDSVKSKKQQAPQIDLDYPGRDKDLEDIGQ